MHLADPVGKRIHAIKRRRHIGSSELSELPDRLVVEVEARVLSDEPVVRGVVQSADERVGPR